MLWSLCKQRILKGISINARACAFLSLTPYVCVCVCVCVVGGRDATQTEATLIFVLESNLACVQNGSLYQLGGSLPCLESGGSISSGSISSGDAFLMTAQREQPDDLLLQRPTIYAKQLFMLYCYRSAPEPTYERPVSIHIILKAVKVL